MYGDSIIKARRSYGRFVFYGDSFTGEYTGETFYIEAAPVLGSHGLDLVSHECSGVRIRIV